MPSPHASRRGTPSPLRDAVFYGALLGVLLAMATYTELTSAEETPASPAPAVIAVSTRAQLAPCRAEKAPTPCFESALAAALRHPDDLAAVLADTNTYARTDPWFSRRCHMLLHEHGRTFRGAVDPTTIHHDGKDCAAGFLHGWMMARLEQSGGLDRGTVNSWCSGDRAPLEHADCEHGIGHVLVRNLRGSLPRALARCRALGDVSFARNCASGAYMENRFGGQGRDGAAPSSFWSDGDAWRPCRGGATPPGLLDVCAAWAVRDVAPARRLGWCGRIGGRGIDVTACRVASGATADVDTPGRAACAASTQCWYGRGYAWAMLGWPTAPSAGGDSSTPSADWCRRGPARTARACASGVGFRRAASLRMPAARAAAVACDSTFSGSMRAACRSGARDRDAAIAYA